jgi:hypothetical protein
MERSEDRAVLWKVLVVHGSTPIRSEQPGQELHGEQRETAAEDDAADLTLGAAFSEHEHQAADDDRDQRQRPRQRSCERLFEIAGGAFPR